MEENTQNNETAYVPPANASTPFSQSPSAERVALEQQFAAGASWFYWIAGLSLINSVVAFFGGSMRFIFGLGITVFGDAFLLEGNLGALGRTLAFGFAVLVALVVALFGYLAHQKMRWVFWLGMALYVLDALLLLFLQDWLSAAVHGYVLYRMFSAVSAIQKLNALES